MVGSRQPSGEAKSAGSPQLDEERLRQELSARLDVVRAELQEAVEVFRLRLEGQIAQVQPVPAGQARGRVSRA